jgi:hypothetical protein
MCLFGSGRDALDVFTLFFALRICAERTGYESLPLLSVL